MQVFRTTKYKDLLLEFVKREVKSRYKQSALGYAWVVLIPVINLVVMSVVFSFFIRIPTGDTPYPIFLFVALVPWIFTAQSISSGTKSLLANKTLITKVQLPRAIFPIASVAAKFIDLILYTIVFVVLMYIFNVGITPTVIWLPIILLVHLSLILGVTFLLSAINVFYRDVENVLEVLLMAWMYLTPVLYPASLVPVEYVWLFNLNPMVGVINSYRNSVLFGMAPLTTEFYYSAAISILLFISGYIFFKRKSRLFADVI